MVRKVCLDSDAIIGLLQNQRPITTRIQSLDADFYTTSITAFEIWTGRKDQEQISELLSWLEIFPFDKESALIAGDMRRELRKRGQEIDIRDLFIGAICIKNAIELLTYNKKHFERLQHFGLKLLSP